MFRRMAEVAQNRYVGVAVIGSITGVLLLLFFLIMRGQRDTVVLQVQPIDDRSIIQVYVGGEVATPGLYSIPRGSRIFDAVNAAGGLLSGADTSAIGLASPLNDADQVIIPPRAQATFTPQPAPATSHPAVATEFGSAVPSLKAEAGPINVNTASAIELELLPDIGPIIAQRIVDYRLQHGPFQSLEELAEISGISERMVFELQTLITLGH